MRVLAAHGLGYGYPGRAVGEGLELRVSAGEVLVVLGPNGCGKTTLFKTLLGLLPPLAGRVTMDGGDLIRLPRRARARLMAYVPQSNEAAFAYTVFEMILMGRVSLLRPFAVPAAADRERAEQVMVQLGIEDLAERDFTRLSGGQRHLVLIARALVQDTPFIILDEPTASLDFGNRQRVLSQVCQLAGLGPGIVLSTHDPDHAFRFADRVMVLQSGTVQAVGPPREVLTAEVLGKVYGIEVEIAVLADGRRVCVPGNV